MSSKGFTLIETLVSLSIFSIAALGLAKAFSDNIRTNTNNERRTSAIMAVQQVLDRLRQSDPATLPSSNSTTVETKTVGFRNFVVTTTYCPTSVATTYCTSPNIRYLNLKAELSGVNVYEVNTIYAQLR